jgi:hypothetical protein
VLVLFEELLHLLEGEKLSPLKETKLLVPDLLAPTPGEPLLQSLLLLN